MVDGNFPNHLVNFTMMNQANIQTNLNYTGEPYYYTIGVRSENGSIAGTAMFGSRVNSQAKMEDSVFLMFAGLSIFLILLFLYVTIYQSNADIRIKGVESKTDVSKISPYLPEISSG